MDPRTLIWVDLRVQPFATDLASVVRSTYQLRYIREPSVIPKLVAALFPAAICFEYDKPGPKELEPLRRTRLEFPRLPVLMITVEHWEELAVWALRMRVCDYLVVPVEINDLCSRIATLVSLGQRKSLQGELLDRGVPDIATSAARCTNSAHPRDRLLPAISYVEANYSEKVALGVVARLCGLGRYQFSRIFKRVHGTTFRDFLIAHRINRAVHLLHAPGASITDVAFSVGFNDLSHFAHMFRRYVGVCPSDYLNETKSARGEG